MSLNDSTQPSHEESPTVSDDGNNSEVSVAIMGATGSGKSTFMNLVSGSTSFAVGDGLRSCTSQVEVTETSIDGRTVSLIDTPGFDDTNVSDTDLLKMIALTLSTIYRQGHKLTGVIYMHRISDFRVGGTARRNFNMFRHFCGDENLKNVVLVTNMWSLVGNKAIGEAREQELRADPDLFQPVLAGGADMVRHDNTVESAQAILRHIMSFPQCVLRIQRELVDEGKDISETSAGKELDKELAALAEKQNAELEEIQEEMNNALASKDKETAEELAEARDELMKNMAKVKNDRTRVSKEYQVESKKVNDEIRLLELRLRDERHARDLRAEELEIQRLKQEMARKHIDDQELRDLRLQLDELQAQRQRQSMTRRVVAGTVGFFITATKYLTSTSQSADERGLSQYAPYQQYQPAPTHQPQQRRPHPSPAQYQPPRLTHPMQQQPQPHSSQFHSLRVPQPTQQQPQPHPQIRYPPSGQQRQYQMSAVEPSGRTSSRQERPRDGSSRSPQYSWSSRDRA